jgi:hypothetical protein
LAEWYTPFSTRPVVVAQAVATMDIAIRTSRRDPLFVCGGLEKAPALPKFR